MKKTKKSTVSKRVEIAQLIDHTNVSPVATTADIEKLCQEAQEYSFYSVCLTPKRVALARKFLKKTSIKIVCVIGFPHGTPTRQAKVLETQAAINNGADEIDLTIDLGAFKDKNYQLVFQEMKAVVRAAKTKPVKSILEIGCLTEKELRKACQIAEKAGVQFIKTSTGYGPRNVKESDIRLIKQIVKGKMKIKASGGIKTYVEACLMVKAGADRIGSRAGVEMIKMANKIK